MPLELHWSTEALLSKLLSMGSVGSCRREVDSGVTPFQTHWQGRFGPQCSPTPMDPSLPAHRAKENSTSIPSSNPYLISSSQNEQMLIFNPLENPAIYGIGISIWADQCSSYQSKKEVNKKQNHHIPGSVHRSWKQVNPAHQNQSWLQPSAPLFHTLSGFICSALVLNRFCSLYAAEYPTERKKSCKKNVSNHIQLLINSFGLSGKVEESKNHLLFYLTLRIILDEIIFCVYIHIFIYSYCCFFGCVGEEKSEMPGNLPTPGSAQISSSEGFSGD